MTAPAAATTDTRVDIGWVVRSTVRVLLRRSVDLALIALPFVWLPSFLVEFLPKELWQMRLVTGLPALVFIGGASLLTYRELAGGERLNAPGAISAGLRHFGSLWGVSFISGLGVILGLLLFVIPGVILIAAWMTASSAVVVEDKTAFDALDRAWSRSKGSRLRLAGLLGLGLVAFLVLLVAMGIVGLVITAFWGQDTTNTIADFGLGPVSGVLATALTTVGSAAAYTGLRNAKEGSAGDLATVFD